jgi:flagellar biosynthesis protein FlhB
VLNYRVKINLQLFASGEKTEKATPKKRQDARKKGQVLQSKELSTAILLIFLFMGLKIFGSYMVREIKSYAKLIFVQYPNMEGLFTINIIFKLFMETVSVLLRTTAPILAIALIVSLFTGFAQVGFLFTVETLGFKFTRINPLSGFKRMFSMHAIVELAKSIFKIVVIGYIAYSYLMGERNNIINTMNLDPLNIAIYIGSTSINVAIRICVALILMSALDYAYQWWEYEKNLRMSKQEIKEEYKQVEGNPEVKSKIKQKQRQISMKRMMQQVPKADVIITNPTHFAVAVKYDAKVSDAPIVIAKGQDFIALRIKEVGKENKIEIVENKPLARNLYDTVDVGQAIPPELFQAVAEILAFVYSLKGKGNVG